MKQLILLYIGFIAVCYCNAQSSKKTETHTKIQNDSVKNIQLKSCIRETFTKKNWKQFHTCRLIHLALTKKNNDSLSYAQTLEYSGAYFQVYSERPDSAFYYFTKSKLIYQKLGDSPGVGRTLGNTAMLRKNIHDYAGSIANSYKALKYISKKKTRQIASIYNNLGISFNQLKDSSDAIKYHLKSLALRKQLKKYPHLKLQSLNNLAKVYKDYKVYHRAIEYLSPIVRDSMIKKQFSKTYAMALDNYGHTLFLKNQSGKSLQAMQEALKIRDRINHKDGIVINKIHLAQYYLQQKDTTKAIVLARSANTIAKEILNYRDYLVSMKLLARVYKGEQSKELYEHYNRINDSLITADRKYRDRFDQFEFELDEKQHLLLSKEDELTNNRYIFIVIGVLILSFAVLFLINFRKTQKLKKQFQNGFREYIISKYNLTHENIVFWEMWVLDISPEDLAEKLFISLEAVKSRRKSLRNKIYKILKIEGNFTQARAIRIYNQELELYKNLN